MVKEPESMEDILYFTNRVIDSGKIKAWVHKAKCSKCEKGIMGKPVVKGKVKIRANEYVCDSCGYTEEKTEHEDKLDLEVKYTCPHCSNEGETTIKYKKKTFEGVPSYIFVCEKCNKKIGISKKMKKSKKSKKKVSVDES